MTVLSLIVALVVAIPLAQSHYTFVRVSQNGEWQAPTRFFRNKTTPFEEISTPDQTSNLRLYNFPTYSTDLPESVRCGRDHMAYAASTETMTIQAGDTLEFAHQRHDPDEWTDDEWYNCTNGRGSCDPDDASAPDGYMDFNHPGPVLALLSKVPDGQNLTTYDGSGEWTKIYTLGLEVVTDPTTNQTSILWLGWNNQGIPSRVVFTVPPQTPAGQYLLRLDLLWPGLIGPANIGGENFPNGSMAQLYPSCAQLNIESDFSGDLPQGIRIPEDLSFNSSGMASSVDMYNMQTVDPDYVYPGGPLWNGTDLIVDKPSV